MTNGKSLEECTVAELKEIAREAGTIEGLGAMKKADIISAIRTVQSEAAGAVEEVPSEPAQEVAEEKEPEEPATPEPAKKEPQKKASKVSAKKNDKAPQKGDETISSLKAKMVALKEKKAELKERGDKTGIIRLRRRISRLRKRTRKLARLAA